MKKKNSKSFNYFEAFVRLSEYSLKAADILIKALNEFDISKMDDMVKEIHNIEHSADLAKHEILNRLAKEFLPPIEREDIVNLSEKIDDVTDCVEDVLININIFNVQSIPSEVLEFADVIMKCCKSMISAVTEFENFKRSKTLHSEIIEINRLEEVGDSLYVNGVRKLYRNTTNPIELLTWKDIYDSLEKCCDACEIVANDIENIVMKNS